MVIGTSGPDVRGASGSAVSVSVLVDPPAGLGLNCAWTPGGRPVADRETFPVDPDIRFTLIWSG